MRAVVVADDRDAFTRRAQAAQVAAELKELGASLVSLDVPVQRVFAQIERGEQVSYALGALEGCSPPRPWTAIRAGVVLAAAVGPLPAGVRLDVQRPELVHTKDHRRLAGCRPDLAVGDAVQVLDAGLLGRIVRIRGRLPGLYPLKGDVLRAKQLAQPLVGDVLDHPLGDQEVGQLGQTPGRKRQPVLDRLGRGDLFDLPPLREGERRRPTTLVPGVQGVKPMVVEVVDHIPDTVFAGKSHLGDLAGAHALGRQQHHLRPPPGHHRPAAPADDTQQPASLILIKLPYPYPLRHDPSFRRSPRPVLNAARRAAEETRQSQTATALAHLRCGAKPPTTFLDEIEVPLFDVALLDAIDRCTDLKICIDARRRVF